MRERVSMFGGHMHIREVPGECTHAMVEMPFDA